MPPRQLRILSNAPEIERLRDSSRRYAKTLADLIQGYTTEFHSEPAKADYRTACNAAAAIFKALGQMSIKDNVLHGEERLGTIKKAFEWLKKLESGFRPNPEPRHAQRGPTSWDIRMLQKEEPDYELWFKAGVRATTKHAGAFLHAVRMFSEVDRGVKAPALPVENRNQKADAIEVLDPRSTEIAEATPNVDDEAGAEGTPANPKSSTEAADASAKANSQSKDGDEWLRAAKIATKANRAVRVDWPWQKWRRFLEKKNVRMRRAKKKDGAENARSCLVSVEDVVSVLEDAFEAGEFDQMRTERDRRTQEVRDQIKTEFGSKTVIAEMFDAH